MGEVVAAACVSHSPGLTGFPDAAPDAAERVLEAFAALRTMVADTEPDAMVVVSSEHFTNFFVNNLPTFAVGAAAGYDMPASDALARFLCIDRCLYPGHQALGDALYRALLTGNFDPSLVAGGYGFDEGFAVPLALLGGARVRNTAIEQVGQESVRAGLPCGAMSPVPVVPVVVNAVHPPMPSLERCYAFGQALGAALAEQHVAERVAVVGSGGLSHWVGLPEAGQIDVDFDNVVLDALSAADGGGLCTLDEAMVDAAGNGAHEVRAWLVVAGIVGSVPFEVLAYEPVPAWLTGTAVLRARMAGRQRGTK